MGKFVSVSGSLICNDNQFDLIKKIISSYDNSRLTLSKEEINLYNSGWLFNHNEFNWSRYIFYGGDIKESGVDYIKSQVNEIITKLKLLDSEEDREIEGIFYFNPEDNDKYLIWKLGSSIQEFII